MKYTNIINVSDHILKLLNECSPINSLNAAECVDYEDFKFNDLIKIIILYRKHKRCKSNRFIYAFSPPLTGSSMAGYSNKEYFYSSVQNWFKVRSTYYCIPEHSYEYDQFLIRYISIKFNCPIYLINSYIKISNFITDYMKL